MPTRDNALRFPDVTVTCSSLDGRSRLIASPVVVFEITSPSSVRNDKLVKLEEYRAVRSIHTYVAVEQEFAALTVFSRWEIDKWMARALVADQILRIDPPALTLPVADIYAGVTFEAETAG